jgi:hypothetical protein
MSLHICLICDKCEAQSSPHHGTATDARVAEFKHGWFYNMEQGEEYDLCPVCSGRDLEYWTTEPF